MAVRRSRKRGRSKFRKESLGNMEEKQAEQAKLFIGNLAFTTTTDQLREMFAGLEGSEVVDAVVLTDKMTGRSRGFGFVTYATTEMAQKAIEAFNGKDVDGRAIRVDFARPSEKRENSHA